MSEVELTDPQAGAARRLRSLLQPSVRSRRGEFLVEGPQAVRELLDHRGDLVRDVYLTPEQAQRMGALLEDFHVHLASEEVLESVSADAQSVVAVATDLLSAVNPAIAALRDGDDGGEEVHLATPLRLLAILHEIREPGNFGAVIRSADAAGADEVWASAASASATNPKVIRASAGSLFHLPVRQGGQTMELVEAARRAGLQVFATAADGEVSLDQLSTEQLSAPTAWVFGNEAHGLPAEVLAGADARVRIPIFGQAESLNLAMAATLCLYTTAAARIQKHR